MGAGFGVDTSGETGALLYLHLPTLELTVQQLSVVVYDCLFAHCNDVRGEPFIERQRVSTLSPLMTTRSLPFLLETAPVASTETQVAISVSQHPRLGIRNLQEGLTLDIRVKEQYLVDSVQPVRALLSARMAESSDGLIFARADRPYRSNDHTSVCVHLGNFSQSLGSQSILRSPRYKWKPPEHLSLDVLLQLRFPPVVDGPEDQPDFGAVPHFHLCVPNGGRLQFFDHLAVSAAVWEE
jgi:hypothetical protein